MNWVLLPWALECICNILLAIWNLWLTVKTWLKIWMWFYVSTREGNPDSTLGSTWCSSDRCAFNLIWARECVFCAQVYNMGSSTEPPSCAPQLVFTLRQRTTSILSVSLVLDLSRRCYEGNGWGGDPWRQVVSCNYYQSLANPKGRKDLRTFKININKQKVTYFYQVLLTCISIELFTSKAIKLFLFILLVPLTII